MDRRSLHVLLGAFLGTVLALVAVHWAENPGVWPRSEQSEALAELREVMRLVHEQHVDAGRVGYRELARGALHGMVESLDPHSEFLEAGAFADLQDEMRSEFGGIGLQVELREGHVVVIVPLAGTPSDRAGLRRGDRIVRIDGQFLEKPDLDDVVARLRGKPTTRVTVGWVRPPETVERQTTLVRETIRTESVAAAEVLSGNIGYIRISQFSEHTGEEFIKALNTLAGHGVAGLILDLRNNPGGLLEAAVEVSEPFFRKGELIVTTEGRQAKDREELRAENDQEPVRVPIAVLVNQSSASAAEIVAGALKDTGRAVIVGERSFGKGSVQSILQLSTGDGLRLTTARYLTPSGRTLHKLGVEPQVEVVASEDEDDNIRLQQSRPDIKTDEDFLARFGMKRLPDRQLGAALEVVNGLIVLAERHIAAPAL
ncbi:S41 family peptidase [Nibricoccus sp. IMCC34717]|uniref:S41 family peptidase n=1 Tax=Nibricoccus sp. IMCC34717 TaxID=3034021 RepID=UPI00384A6648